MQHLENQRVRELMSSQVVSITPEESVRLAARLMSRHNLGSLPVCDEKGCLLGIVTDRDIVLRCVAEEKDPAQVAVSQVMSSHVASVTPDTAVQAAAGTMARRQIRRLPVVEGGALVGMLSLGDLAVRPSCEMEAAEALEGISENVKQGS